MNVLAGLVSIVVWKVDSILPRPSDERLVGIGINYDVIHANMRRVGGSDWELPRFQFCDDSVDGIILEQNHVGPTAVLVQHPGVVVVIAEWPVLPEADIVSRLWIIAR